MRATEILKYEHDDILLVLNRMEKEIAPMAETGNIPVERLCKMIDFCQNFADKFHHGKEENHLFLKLIENGMERESCPLAVMYEEHDMGRKNIQKMKKAIESIKEGNLQFAELLCSNMQEYIELLRDHIAKENYILFQMADQILKPEDQEYLTQVFEEIQTQDEGKAFYQKYHTMAQELAL